MLMRLTAVIIIIIVVMGWVVGGGGDEGLTDTGNVTKLMYINHKINKKTKSLQDVVLPPHFDALLVPVDK